MVLNKKIVLSRMNYFMHLEGYNRLMTLELHLYTKLLSYQGIFSQMVKTNFIDSYARYINRFLMYYKRDIKKIHPKILSLITENSIQALRDKDIRQQMSIQIFRFYLGLQHKTEKLWNKIDNYVMTCIALQDPKDWEDTIAKAESLGTRFHNTALQGELKNIFDVTHSYVPLQYKDKSNPCILGTYAAFLLLLRKLKKF